MKICIVPGSFDPMTLGHRSVIERASELFDRVIVAIMQNENKKGRFSYEDRLEIAKLTLRGLDVEIVVKDGFLADFAAETGACALVKGIRNAQDLEYENNMYEFNISRNHTCDTVYLPAEDKYRDFSSSSAYANIRDKGSSQGMLDPEAEKYILTLLKK